MNKDTKTLLDFSEILLKSGVAGLFATDHTRTRDFFQEPHPSCPTVLGMFRARFPETPIGPLVSRVGSGLDEYAMSMLETLGGPLVVSLGIGDAKGRLENKVSNLPWPSVDERWDRLCRFSERCLNKGFETYAATDRVDLVSKLPQTIGVHIQHVSGEEFSPRPLARGVFSKTNVDFIEYSIRHSFTWLVIAQAKNESNVSYLGRIKKIAALQRSLL